MPPWTIVLYSLNAMTAALNFNWIEASPLWVFHTVIAPCCLSRAGLRLPTRPPVELLLGVLGWRVLHCPREFLAFAGAPLWLGMGRASLAGCGRGNSGRGRAGARP